MFPCHVVKGCVLSTPQRRTMLAAAARPCCLAKDQHRERARLMDESPQIPDDGDVRMPWNGQIGLDEHASHPVQRHAQAARERGGLDARGPQNVARFDPLGRERGICRIRQTHAAPRIDLADHGQRAHVDAQLRELALRAGRQGRGKGRQNARPGLDQITVVVRGSKVRKSSASE